MEDIITPSCTSVQCRTKEIFVDIEEMSWGNINFPTRKKLPGLMLLIIIIRKLGMIV